MTQSSQEFILGAVGFLSGIAGGGELAGIFHAIGNISDIELEDRRSVLDVEVTDDFQMANLVCLDLDRAFVAKNSFFLQFTQCFFDRHTIREEACLLKLVADEVLPICFQQVADDRIGVGNFQRGSIHNENAIFRCLKEAPVAAFRATDQIQLPTFGDIVDRQKNALWSLRFASSESPRIKKHGAVADAVKVAREFKVIEDVVSGKNVLKKFA